MVEGVGVKGRNNCQEKWRWMFLGCLEGNREGTDQEKKIMLNKICYIQTIRNR